MAEIPAEQTIALEHLAIYRDISHQELPCLILLLHRREPAMQIIDLLVQCSGLGLQP